MTHPPSDRSLSDLADLAQRVDTFLRSQGARTERERHDPTHIRVLATLE